MKYVMSITILFLSLGVQASCYQKIPIELAVQKNKESIFNLSWKVPKEYKGLHLVTASYFKNKKAKYLGRNVEASNSSHAIYELQGTEMEFRDAIISIMYANKSNLCYVNEAYNWEKILGACDGCAISP